MRHLYLRTVGGRTFRLEGYGDPESVDLWALIAKAQRNHEDLTIRATIPLPSDMGEFEHANTYHLNPDNIDCWWVA